MKQPPAYVHPQHLGYVCRLLKALNNLKQTPRAWYQCFVVYITSLGFWSSRSNNFLFTYHQGKEVMYAILYVDDNILTTSNPAIITRVISRLSAEFSMMNHWPLSYFLDIAATHSKHGLFMVLRHVGSTSRLCVYLGDNFVSWSPKRQHVVYRSSVEAEYKGSQCSCWSCLASQSSSWIVMSVISHCYCFLWHY